MDENLDIRTLRVCNDHFKRVLDALDLEDGGDRIRIKEAIPGAK